MLKPSERSEKLDRDESPMKARYRQCSADLDAIWSPPATPAAPPPVVVTIPADIEAMLLDEVKAPLPPGMTAHDGNRRKEHLIGALFDGLSIPHARALHARLSRPRKDDALAAAFGRLVAERRDRLLAFLADARRRDAMRSAGRAMVLVVEPMTPAS